MQELARQGKAGRERDKRFMRATSTSSIPVQKLRWTHHPVSSNGRHRTASVGAQWERRGRGKAGVGAILRLGLGFGLERPERC